MRPEEVQPLDLLDKDFKTAIANICRELKETMSKELKENMNAKIIWLHLYQMSKIGRYIKTESRFVFARAWGKGGMGMLMGLGFFLGGWKCTYN